MASARASTSRRRMPSDSTWRTGVRFPSTMGTSAGKALRHAQAGGAGGRVGGAFGLTGRDAAGMDELEELGQRLRGEASGTVVDAREAAQRLLDDAVLQAVEADDGQAA